MSGSNGAICFRRSAEALSRRVGAEVLVTTPGDPDVHELSGGASAVWLGLEIPSTLPVLVGRLALGYGVRAGQISAQVEECVMTLLGLGLVVEQRAPAGSGEPTCG